MQIADRVFVVTGSSSGIGRETARALVDRGGRVALVARREERLRELTQELGAASVAIPADVTTAEAPDRIYAATIEAFGRIDGLLNVAGRGMTGRIVDFDMDTFDESIELNLIAPIRLIQRIVPTFIEQEEGVVVNVSSPTSVLGLPNISGYAMAKAALNAMSAALRRELVSAGVRVMVVFPGVADTEYYDRIMGEPDDQPRPPARPPAVVAQAIVHGIERNRREVWCLSSRERRSLRIMRLIGRLAPTTLDRGLAKR